MDETFSDLALHIRLEKGGKEGNEVLNLSHRKKKGLRKFNHFFCCLSATNQKKGRRGSGPLYPSRGRGFTRTSSRQIAAFPLDPAIKEERKKGGEEGGVPASLPYSGPGKRIAAPINRRALAQFSFAPAGLEGKGKEKKKGGGGKGGGRGTLTSF